MRIAHNAVSLIGQKFNMLTPIEKITNYNDTGRTYYKCLCDCGNISYHSHSCLKSNKAFSCGCVTRRKPSRKDYVGQRFSKLTVVEMLYNYRNNQTYAKCNCECGNETIVYVGNLVQGHTVSCGCYEEESRFNRENHEKNLVGQRFGHLEVLSMSDKRYKNGGVGWLCKCDCGNELIVRSTNLLRGKTRSCGCNKRSQFEEYIEELLHSWNIDFISEYSFDDCKNHYKLRFDFYIKDHNGMDYCIEYNGQQHYESVEYFGGDSRFEKQKENDSIKAEYCKDNDITLIVLPYTMSREDIKDKLFEILEPVTTTVV